MKSYSKTITKTEFVKELVRHQKAEYEVLVREAVRLAILDGAKFIGGAAGNAFSETRPNAYIEEALSKLKTPTDQNKQKTQGE